MSLIWSLIAGAETTSPVQQLTERLRELSSYQADFEQTIVNDKDVVLQQTTGVIKVKRPGKLYWQTTEPWQQSIVSNGETLWRYDADLEQVIIEPFDERFNQTPTLLLSGETDLLSQQYAVVVQGESFVLTPKTADNLFETLTFEFKDGQIVRMEFSDSLGQTTRIQFQNIQINQPVPDQQFLFEPPAGVDVLVDE